MPKAKYQSKSHRGFRKRNEGYHLGDKKKRGGYNSAFTQDDSLRAICDKDVGKEADRDRLAMDAAHKALTSLQAAFRRIYCKGCIVHRAGRCDGSLCRVAVEIIPKKDVSRIWRSMPSPDHPLPVKLGKPKPGSRRILPKKGPGL